MSTAATPRPGPHPHPHPKKDPREFHYLPVRDLVIDDRVQREIDIEQVHRTSHEWDWNRFECLTVARHPTLRGKYLVIEGQHRRESAALFGGGDLLVPCFVLPGTLTEQQQAQIALDIVNGRRDFNALEKWKGRRNSGHSHEILAEVAMEERGIRLGKSTSATTIAAVATVRSIVHGGAFSAEYGAQMIGDTIDTIVAAYPTWDAESTVTRWNRYIMLAVSNALHRWPDMDRERFVESMKVRPAMQWINIGKGTGLPDPDLQILNAILEGYNKGRQAKARLSL